MIAADQRVDPVDVAAYESIADRVLRCEFTFLEAHLAWLHGECSGEWVFRLDGDEQVSPELLAVLPELIAAPDIRQYWFPRRWLDPSGRGWLDELPWAPDYQNRLVRNDPSLSFEGVLHTNAIPAYPARYRSEPLYHHLCRARNARGAARARPVLRNPTASRTRSGRRACEREVLLAGALRPPTAEGALTRAVEQGIGSMRLLEPDLRMTESEVRGLFVEVTNHSGFDWPGGMEEPLVRLSYRWREDPIDRDRTPLPAPLPSGDSAIMPITVAAPAEQGRYRLQLDLVHEHVRWLEAGIDVTIDVVPRGLTQRNVPGQLQRLLGRQRIPRVLHRIWLGPEPMPEAERGFGETWARHHPGWEHRLWCDADLPELGIPAEIIARAESPVELADIARFLIIARHGGVYVDTDFECLRPLDPLLKGVDAFAAFQRPGEVATGLLGATAGHPAFRRAAELVTETFGRAPLPASTGPPFFTHLLWDFPEVTLFPPELFYPYLWTSPSAGTSISPARTRCITGR